jgi:hypothetical protein
VAAVYRVRQFVRAAGAWLRPQATGDALAARYLSPEALELFRAMPRYDRQHALSVLQTLQDRGHTQPDLLAAALLHDVGKAGAAGKVKDGANTPKGSGGLRLWHRVAVVLMRAFRPGLLERIGEDRPGSWRRPFFVQQHHAAIGAELAQQAGCSTATVKLIRYHEDPPGQVEDPLLKALQAADGVN